MATEQKRRPPDSASDRRNTGQNQRSRTGSGASAKGRPGNVTARHPPEQRQRGKAGAGTETRKRQQQGRPRKRRQTAKPEVHYTPPKPFNRNRFLLRLATAAAVALAAIFCLFIFFRVNIVTVSGNALYSSWDVYQASGISEGEGLLTLGKARASSRILTQLPYVESVRIGIKLPNTVNIEVQEVPAVYAVQAEDGAWWWISSAGTAVEQTTAAEAAAGTRITGVQIVSPQPRQQVIAAEAAPAPSGTADPSDPSGVPETVPVTVTGAQRLQSALNLLQGLESSGLVGQMAEINVASTQAITAWYGEQFYVQLGDGGRMDYKLQCLKQAISQMSDYSSGILDVSFTAIPDGVGYTPSA